MQFGSIWGANAEFKLTAYKQELTRDYLIKFLAEARVKKWMPVSRLEREAGVYCGTFNDIMRGKTSNFRVDKLQKILKVLGYDLVIQPAAPLAHIRTMPRPNV